MHDAFAVVGVAAAIVAVNVAAWLACLPTGFLLFLFLLGIVIYHYSPSLRRSIAAEVVVVAAAWARLGARAYTRPLLSSIPSTFCGLHT